MRRLSDLPEIEVDSFRAAILWAGEHNRLVTYVAADDEAARRAKHLFRDRLGPRAKLVRIVLASDLSADTPVNPIPLAPDFAAALDAASRGERVRLVVADGEAERETIGKLRARLGEKRTLVSVEVGA
jgi:hypothetical protein